MAYEDYLKAQKMGLKDFKSATNKGQYPYAGRTVDSGAIESGVTRGFKLIKIKSEKSF